MPFEEEVGSHLSLEDMQQAVVHKKIRPKFRADWFHHNVRSYLFCHPLWIQDIASVHCSPKHTLGLAKNLVDSQFLFSFFFLTVSFPKLGKSKSRQKFQVLFYYKNLNKIISEGTARELSFEEWHHWISWIEARDQDSYHSRAGNDRSTAVVVQSSGSAKTLVENQFSLFFF